MSYCKLPDQYELFPPCPEASAPHGALDGLTVHLDRHCRCGSILAVIHQDRGSYVCAVRCPACDRFRHQLPRAILEFLLELVAQCGRPNEPIEIYERVETCHD